VSFPLFHASRVGILALSVMGVAGGLVMSTSAHASVQPFLEGSSLAISGPAPQYDDGSPGRLVCRDVWVQKEAPPEDQHRVAGTVIGAVAGGLLGNQIGRGGGRTLATVGGAVAGGYVGNRVQANAQANRTYTVRERQCWHEY
jgi:uncharacterized protein YcfJ